jgi:predicted ribonuclease YlaK
MSYEIINRQSSYARLSDPELLQKLIGVRQTRKLYQGSLSAVFAASHDTVKVCGSAGSGETMAQRRTSAR